MEKNEKAVTLSAALEIISYETGLHFSKTELLEAGSKAGMVSLKGKQKLLNVSAFIEHLENNSIVPEEKTKYSKKEAAARYRTRNMTIMQTLHSYLFEENNDSPDKDLLFEMLMEAFEELPLASIKKDGTTFTETDLTNHLLRFVPKKTKEIANSKTD